jgi:hypothetical protein
MTRVGEQRKKKKKKKNYTLYVNNLESQNVLEVNEPVLIVRPDDGPIGPKHVAFMYF